MPDGEWEVGYYETGEGINPVEAFLASLPAKHRAKFNRVLYLRDGDLFVLFAGFHKTSDRDLDRAVRDAQRHLEQYRKEK